MARLAQPLLALAAAIFRLVRVVTATSLENLDLALVVASPMVALALIGTFLFRGTRTLIADRWLLGLTGALGGFSTLVFSVVHPNESGSSIVYFAVPAQEALALAVFVALWAIGRRFGR